MATDALAATPESPPAPLTALAPLRPHRITVDEYMRMADAGVFGPEPKLELIEGVIVEKMTKHTPHVVAAALLQRWFHQNQPAGTSTLGEAPLTIIERHSEPEPDAVIVRGDPQDFVGRRITPGDTLLVVEVAESSLDADRGPKLALYAASGTPVYWILNLVDRRLEIYTRPVLQGSSWTYAVTRFFSEGDDAPFEIEGRELGRVSVRALLPRV